MTTTVEPPFKERQENWWRIVLGEYPTGVALITSLDEVGEPVGMVVGTFTAVSADPPIVGFFPVSTSRTLRHIRRTGRFVANVLGAGHEDLCRAFAQSLPDRFAAGTWVTNESGIPRLANAVAWFEADVRSIAEVGDHDFVQGDLVGLGVGDGSAGLPLLFLRGGYGSFTVPALRFDLDEFGLRLRTVDAMREELDAAAHELDAELVLSTIVGDQAVVVAAANIAGQSHRSTSMGMTYPFAAPVSQALAAWSSEATRKTWIERTRHLVGSVDRTFLNDLLDTVRRQGFGFAVGTAMADFDAIVADPSTGPAQLTALWGRIQQDYLSELATPDWRTRATSLLFPVFDQDGFADFELVVSGFTPPATEEAFAQLERRARECARRLTELNGGILADGF